MLEHPDLNKRCLSCSSSLVRILGRDGGPSQIALCTQCPLSPRVCWSCLSPLQSSTIEATPGCCSNKSCQLVSSLLNCDLVTDPKSHVRGCPEFRACPRCYSLIMHTSGCKYMCCFSCQNRFCWICLQPSEECGKDKELYWSLYCSKPTVGRQVFTT
ncbi:probable E3 ubiquitin-protein ligase RNF144A-B isoform X2 [Coregonus clupeaformis]|nr:probable E3 ubiquitin-protein ligase RNF144A-B isoform X2 [Coregonus clupeaformis]